jgi:hypothetical protein
MRRVNMEKEGVVTAGRGIPHARHHTYQLTAGLF